MAANLPMTAVGPLPEPRLVWRDGAPAASGFDDIYFNPEDGLAETRHVFLKGTGLPERWSRHSTFTIGELGFGTGLNFLAAWDLWSRTKAEGAHLHYVSVEGSPLTVSQLKSVHESFSDLAEYAVRLRRIYPPRARGHHLLHVAGDVTLHLLFGEASHMLAGLEAEADAWFLDGFAPAKNPDMWDPALLKDVARCSAPGSRLASFTVAGAVRRGLEAAGFAVRKAPGFGRKREMLEARFEHGRAHQRAPWYARPRPARPGPIAVIGAGIAGLACAGALRRQGCEVILMDAASAPGAGASGTPSGLVMPRLSAAPDGPARFYAAAHRFAAATFRTAGALSHGGALNLPAGPGGTARLSKTIETGLFDAARAELLSAEDASARAGTQIRTPALFFADGGQLNAARYFEAAMHGAAFSGAMSVHKILPEATGWRLAGPQGEILGEARTVVVATAMATAHLLPQAALPLAARHGQITRTRGGRLELPVAYGGYAAPLGEDIWIGATHTPLPKDKDTGFDPQADQSNMKAMGEVMPELAAHAKVSGHWTGVRATTPDRLPLAGPVADSAAFHETFAGLARGVPGSDAEPPYLPDLYVVSGLGARGFVSAPLLGELIAAQILGLPSPVERDVRHLLHPARFDVRALKRGGTLP